MEAMLIREKLKEEEYQSDLEKVFKHPRTPGEVILVDLEEIA
jgi:hypothetical protein